MCRPIGASAGLANADCLRRRQKAQHSNHLGLTFEGLRAFIGTGAIINAERWLWAIFLLVSKEGSSGGGPLNLPRG